MYRPLNVRWKAKQKEGKIEALDGLRQRAAVKTKDLKTMMAEQGRCWC
jgi:hypothetical protein